MAMHPIAQELKTREWTQQRLVDEVNKLKLRRPNGERIRLTQGFLSSVISDKPNVSRGLSAPMADAIARVLGLDAMSLLLYKRPTSPRRRNKQAA